MLVNKSAVWYHTDNWNNRHSSTVDVIKWMSGNHPKNVQVCPNDVWKMSGYSPECERKQCPEIVPKHKRFRALSEQPTEGKFQTNFRQIRFP